MPSVDTESKKQLLRDIYEQYYFLLYRYALTKLNQDEDAAANCAHAVFDAAGKNIDKLRQHGNMGGWLMDALKKNIANYYRTHRMQREKDTLYAAMLPAKDLSFELWPEDIYTDEALSRAKDALLSLLTPGEAELYRLHYAEKKRLSEISSQLGISVAAVKMRLMRLRGKLYAEMKKYF